MKRDSRSIMERGFTLLGVLLFVVVMSSLLITVLKIRRSGIRTVSASETRSKRYYEVETTYAKTLNWLRANSKKMLYIFKRDQFYGTFDVYAHSVGTNDSNYTNPTSIKLTTTTNSAILTNDTGLATQAYPASEHIESGSPFTATTEFSSASLGNAKVKVTLVEAFPDDSSKDYGAPPQPTPDTDFVPVYRIDVMNSSTSGTHIVAHVVGKLDYNGAALKDVDYAVRDYAEYER